MKHRGFSIHLTLVATPASGVVAYAATERATLATAILWAMRQWPRTGITAEVEDSTWLPVVRETARQARVAELIAVDLTGQAETELAALVEAGTVRVEESPTPGSPPFYAALEPLPVHTPPGNRRRRLRVAQ